jgi:hypothetical protein
VTFTNREIFKVFTASLSCRSWSPKIGVVLHVSTKVVVTEAREKYSLALKQSVAKFDSGGTRRGDRLEAKLEIRNQWLNCSSGLLEWKLRKTGNEYSNEIVWEWFASARAMKFTVPNTVVQEGANSCLIYRRKVDL